MLDFSNYQNTSKQRQDNQEERMHDTDGAQKTSTAASIHWPPAQCWVVLSGLWEKHSVVSSFTLTVTVQSAISLHPSDYVHAKHDCTQRWQHNQSHLTMAQNGKIALQKFAIPDYYLGKYKVNNYYHTFRTIKNMTFAQHCNCNIQEKEHFKTMEFLRCGESREERHTAVLPS